MPAFKAGFSFSCREIRLSRSRFLAYSEAVSAHRLMDRTRDCGSRNRGSIPRGRTKTKLLGFFERRIMDGRNGRPPTLSILLFFMVNYPFHIVREIKTDTLRARFFTRTCKPPINRASPHSVPAVPAQPKQHVHSHDRNRLSEPQTQKNRFSFLEN